MHKIKVAKIDLDGVALYTITPQHRYLALLLKTGKITSSVSDCGSVNRRWYCWRLIQDLCGHEQEMSGYNAETVSVDLVVDGKVGHSSQYCHRQS